MPLLLPPPPLPALPVVRLETGDLPGVETKGEEEEEDEDEEEEVGISGGVMGGYER